MNFGPPPNVNRNLKVIEPGYSPFHYRLNNYLEDERDSVANKIHHPNKNLRKIQGFDYVSSLRVPADA